MESITQKNRVLEEIAELSKAEFECHPMTLSLNGMFYDKEITYTFEEYLEHLRLTKDIADKNTNYNIKLNKVQAFRNIPNYIRNGKWVIISKNKAPVIHFIIRHSKMVSALEDFIIPVTEE